MAFRKRASVELLATYASLDTGWKKVASAKSAALSKFANSNYRSIQEILDSVADKFVISKDPTDYVFAIYRAVTQDVPNGNGDAFPREELLNRNKFEKKPVYMTFEFKPHFVNHQSEDARLSRGVVVDVHFNETDPNDCFVELLIAVDKKKDPVLAQGVVDGILNTVSMGCDSLRTECNVCDNSAFSPADYCIHIKSHKLKMCKNANGEMKLAFERCYEVTFQEISNVDDPADKKAEQQEVLTVAALPDTKVASAADLADLRARVRQTSEAQYPAALARAASQAEMVALAAQTPLPEHHRVAAIFNKHFESAFDNSVTALAKTAEETGKSEDDVRRAWNIKIAESVPDPRTHDICALLNAHVATCGDMRKAIKRTAKDLDVDPDIVGKCAEYMRECNRMPNAAQPKAAQEAPKKDESPKAAQSDAPPSAQPPKKESAEAPAIDTNLPGLKDAPALGTGEKQDVSSKIAQAAKEEADKVAAAEKEKADKEVAKKAQSGNWQEGNMVFKEEGILFMVKAIRDSSMGNWVTLVATNSGRELSGPQKSFEDLGYKAITGQNYAASAKSAAEGKEKADKEAARVAQSEKDMAEVAKMAQAEEEACKAEKAATDKKKEDDAKSVQAGAPPAAQTPVAQAGGDGQVEHAQVEDAPNKKSLGDMGVKSAGQFPFAKFYSDVKATKVASGEVIVTRAGNQIFAVPASKQASAKEVLTKVATVGVLAAKKHFGGMSKQADAGIAEGAVTDAKGAYGPSPQSSQEGAISDTRDSRKVNPASTTAEGHVTDMRDNKQEVKSLSNSDVRDQATTDLKGGYANSADSLVGQEPSDRKVNHDPKNVGSDNVLSDRVVDMVLKGLDPRAASLVRENLKVAQADMKEEACEAAKKAQDEKDKAEKEASTRRAQEEKEKVEKAAEKEIEDKAEKKAKVANDAFVSRFKRGLRIAARRFALNIEPCDLKYNFGEVLSSRHEASGFAGMEQDLVMDVIERGFNQNAAMMKTTDHLVRRATELTAMPDDSLAAIEADAEKMSPVSPGSHEVACDTPAMDKQSDLRRRASNGSLPAVRSSISVNPTVSTKTDLVRAAVGGGSLGRRFL